MEPVDDWQAAIAEAGELTGPIAAAVVDEHGDRGKRAIEAVGEGRVKRYRDFTVVVGHDDEYVIEDGECTCADATYNLDAEDPGAVLACDRGRRGGRGRRGRSPRYVVLGGQGVPLGRRWDSTD